MTRLYTDEELGALIKRATERQAAASLDSDGGLPLAEIETLAAELGIEAEHLRAAAFDLDKDAALAPRFRLLGGPFRDELESVVESGLSEEDWELVVHEVRSWTGAVGTTSQMGRSREWSHDLDGLAHTHLALSPRGKQAMLRLRQGHVAIAGLAYLAATALGAGAAGLLLESTSGLHDAVLVGAFAGIVLAACTAARFALAAWGRSRRERLRAFAKRIGALLSESASSRDHVPETELHAEEGALPLRSPEASSSRRPRQESRRE